MSGVNGNQPTAKRIGVLALLVVGGLVPSAEATVVLVIRQDGSGAIVNEETEAITYDSYQILDEEEPGRFIPENFRSVESLITSGKVDEVLATLGPYALEFGTAGLSPNNLAEITARAGGTLQPGASWSLGKPFPAGLTLGSIEGEYYGEENLYGIRWYCGSAEDCSCWRGIRIEVPEPSGWVLGGTALLGILAAARRPRGAASPR